MLRRVGGAGRRSYTAIVRTRENKGICGMANLPHEVIESHDRPGDVQRRVQHIRKIAGKRVVLERVRRRRALLFGQRRTCLGVHGGQRRGILTLRTESLTSRVPVRGHAQK